MPSVVDLARYGGFLTHTLWSVCIACGIVLTLVMLLQSSHTRVAAVVRMTNMAREKKPALFALSVESSGTAEVQPRP